MFYRYIHEKPSTRVFNQKLDQDFYFMLVIIENHMDAD